MLYHNISQTIDILHEKPAELLIKSGGSWVPSQNLTFTFLLAYQHGKEKVKMESRSIKKMQLSA